MHSWPISLIFSNKVLKYNTQVFVLLVCFFSIHSTLAEISVEDSDRVCADVKDTKNKENVFCFFSLNSPDEQIKLEDIYGKNVEGVKVVEFYGTANTGESVEERYKEMLRKQECDHIIHSGHSVGYVAGNLSINKNKEGKRNEDWKLDLDFLEDMSCEPGCEKWFSNVKSVFLMGCQTVKTDEEYEEPPREKDYIDKYSPDDEIKYKTPDSEHIRVGKKYDVKANYSHFSVNQAYSSTLGTNDKLSHRFLGMYPNSSIYGWGDSAPGKGAGSANSLPRFIDWVTAIDSKLGKNEKAPESINYTFDPQNILNFIEYMNNQPHPVCREVGTLAWTRHWDKGTLPTACYLSGDQDFKKKFAEYHQQGCDLTRALKSNDEKGDEEAIQSSLDEILKSEDSIKANFNRLMSLVIDRRNKNKSWYPAVIDKLKGKEGESNLLRNTLIAQIKSNRVGFTRKSDYLYFYKQMGWTDSVDELSTDSVNELSAGFLNQLESVFDKVPKDNKKPKFHQSFHLSVLNSIENNGLQGWLYKNGPEAKSAFESFMNHVAAVYPDVTKETQPYEDTDVRWIIYRSFNRIKTGIK